MLGGDVCLALMFRWAHCHRAHLLESMPHCGVERAPAAGRPATGPLLRAVTLQAAMGHSVDGWRRRHSSLLCHQYSSECRSKGSGTVGP